MNLEKLLEKPDQFLLAFEANDAVVIEMDRAAYERSVFLDGRISPRAQTITKVPLTELYAITEASPVSEETPGIIYHVAHCGSTLLARALDLPEQTLVLREPMALRQLGAQAGAAPAAMTHPEWTRRARLLIHMMSRRYADGPVIVKANVPVNFMISPLMEMAPNHRAMAIYFSLEDYLIAIMRSPNHRRWIENISREVGAGMQALTGHAPSGTIAEMAALLWLAQMKAFADLLERNPNAASLNAEDLFNRPQDTVSAAFAHFGAPQSDAKVKAITDSDLFSHYSKNPGVAFTNAARLERKKKSSREIEPEMSQARALLDRLPLARALPQRLGRDLLGGGVDLLSPAS